MCWKLRCRVRSDQNQASDPKANILLKGHPVEEWRVNDLTGNLAQRPRHQLNRHSDHEVVLTRLANMLAPGGTLAVQMPCHFEIPAHLAIEETKADPRWNATL